MTNDHRDDFGGNTASGRGGDFGWAPAGSGTDEPPLHAGGFLGAEAVEEGAASLHWFTM